MLTLLLLSTFCQLESGPLKHESVEDARDSFLRTLNGYRQQKLTHSSALTAQAQRHAETMARLRSFNHSFLVRGLYIPSGENIGRGQRADH